MRALRRPPYPVPRFRSYLAPFQDVFKSVERLCEAEGIDCAKFMYRDNTTILETLEGSR